MRLGRLLPGRLQVAAASLATQAAPLLVTASDHERLRAASQTATLVVRAASADSSSDAPRTFTASLDALTINCCCPTLGCRCRQRAPRRRAPAALPPLPPPLQPPPNSQLCGGMAFSMSLFFPGLAIDPALLEPALRNVLTELPHLAGRGATLGSGSRLSDTVMRCSNAGVQLATAAAPGVRLQDVGPHTWSSYNANRPPGALPLPFYAQPLSATASMAGRAPPMGLR